MTEQELRSLPKILPEDAANYLKGTATVSPQAIRLWAQNKDCPFCKAITMKRRNVYVINVNALVRYKEAQDVEI